MWQPSELGTVFAERELLFEKTGQPATAVRVRFGRPVRSPLPEEGDPWWCPIVISGLGDERPEMVAGEDSLQALVLGFDYVGKTLTSRASEAGGTVTWPGAQEHPVFANTWQIEWYEGIISDLFEGVRSAIQVLERDSLEDRVAALDTLRRTLAATHFEPTPRKRASTKESG